LQKYLAGILVATAAFIAALRADESDVRPSRTRAVRAVRRTSARQTTRGEDIHLTDTSADARDAEIADTSLKGVFVRTYTAFNDDRLLSVAAGATFYILLALFPAIAALVSLYGLFADTGSIERNISALSGLLPGGAVSVIHDQLQRLTAAHSSALSLTFATTLLLSIWSANSGMKALFDALNVAYEVPERRSFVMLNLTSLLFTALALVFVAGTIALMVVLPIVFKHAGLGDHTDMAIAWVRYVGLFLATLLALAVLYRYGPNRERARWEWVTWGSVFSTIFWVIASFGFSYYAANFGSFNETYGSLGAVVGFMVWMWLSLTIVLVGARLNCELARRARAKRATGEDPDTQIAHA